MSVTLLLDLDDTLLSNDIHQFLPEYMGAFARYVSDLVHPNAFLRAMQLGTAAMLANRQPDCTLQEAFEAAFFGLLKVDPSEFYAYADRFYEEVFPSLKRITSPIPEAVAMVDEAVRRGYRITITTNPLFPRTANLQRLEWAGLPANQYPFELISSFETFHFSKPNPAFYAETLAYLGWPAGPVIIVGDDLQRDVQAGVQLGVSTYWISPSGSGLPDGAAVPSAFGDQTGVIPWVETIAAENREPDFSSATACVAVLCSTAAALDTLTRDLPGPVWNLAPRAGEWSLNEVACHLRDVEKEVNLERLQRLMKTTNPFLAGQDTDRWAEERNYWRADGRMALREFFSLRGELIQILSSLQEEDWQRPARHAIFGPTRLIELAAIMAAHDRLHLQQALAVMQAELD